MFWLMMRVARCCKSRCWCFRPQHTLTFLLIMFAIWVICYYGDDCFFWAWKTRSQKRQLFCPNFITHEILIRSIFRLEARRRKKERNQNWCCLGNYWWMDGIYDCSNVWKIAEHDSRHVCKKLKQITFHGTHRRWKLAM